MPSNLHISKDSSEEGTGNVLSRKLFFNFLESKRVQVVQLKIQYQKALSILFKNKSKKTYEFHMKSNSTVRSTFWTKTIMKTFIKLKVIAIEKHVCLWSFLHFWHTKSEKLDIIGKMDLTIVFSKKKAIIIVNSTVTWKKMLEKIEAVVIYTPLHDDKFLEVFFWRNLFKAWNCTQGWKVFLDKHFAYIYIYIHIYIYSCRLILS